MIQACYRRYVQYQWYKRYKSAQTIQALYRGYRTKQDFANTKEKIILIQARVRIMNAKAELYRRKYVRTCCVCVYVCHIQGYWPIVRASTIILCTRIDVCVCVLLPHLIQAERIRVENEAAVRIQSHARAFLGRREFLKTKDAAIHMQSVMRMYLGKTEKRRRAEKVAAANKINAAARGWKARNRAREERAAIKIQSARRGDLVRREYKKQRQAAAQVQKIVRGKQARDHYTEQRAALTKIQATVRGKQAREDVKMKNRKALTIQRVLRGHRGRQLAYWVREGQRKAASKVMQTAIRGGLARINYRRTLGAIIRIQCGIRAYRGTKVYFGQCGANNYIFYGRMLNWVGVQYYKGCMYLHERPVVILRAVYKLTEIPISMSYPS